MTADHLTWHGNAVTREQRQAALHQRSVVVWFTGLSGSGKSTLSVALEQYLFEHGKTAYRLDGDNVRHGLNNNLSFSAADRTENIRRIGEVAKLFIDAGVIVLTAFISPYRADRDMVKQLVGAENFFEVYVECPLAECERRDVKGLYAKARAGTIPDFTGVSAPYEAPEQPAVTVHTAEGSIEAHLAIIVEQLKQVGYLEV